MTDDRNLKRDEGSDSGIRVEEYGARCIARLAAIVLFLPELRFCTNYHDDIEARRVFYPSPLKHGSSSPLTQRMRSTLRTLVELQV